MNAPRPHVPAPQPTPPAAPGSRRALVDTNVLLSDPLRRWIKALVAEANAAAEANAGASEANAGSAARTASISLVWTEDVRRELWDGIPHTHPGISQAGRRGIERGWLEACEPEPVTTDDRTVRAYVLDPTDAHLDNAALAGAVTWLVTDDTRAFAPVDSPLRSRIPYALLTADEFLQLLAAEADDALTRAFRSEVEVAATRAARRRARGQSPRAGRAQSPRAGRGRGSGAGGASAVSPTSADREAAARELVEATRASGAAGFARLLEGFLTAPET
ncbi:PIN domain-containing protein [Brevibacterium samyangense]|uniref:PIN domain-containing protein n=1 Tax=Brevibacterium samyangense TaxID=366888 RepID=UPI0031D91E19